MMMAGVHGFLAVALGAFGAHGLRASLAMLLPAPEVSHVAIAFDTAEPFSPGLHTSICSSHSRR